MDSDYLENEFPSLANIFKLGQILKSHRSEMKLTMQDVAIKLNSDYDFINLIENGRELIPVDEILPFIEAYRLEKNFIPVILKAHHPNICELIKSMIPENKTLENAEVTMNNYITKFNI